jgi:hypothetical protein
MLTDTTLHIMTNEIRFSSQILYVPGYQERHGNSVGNVLETVACSDTDAVCMRFDRPAKIDNTQK